MGGSASARWKQVYHSLIEPKDEPLTQIPSTTVGVACPTRGVFYLNRKSMFVHMSKAPKQDPLRPANKAIVFDKSRDAKDGLHICRHCEKSLYDLV